MLISTFPNVKIFRIMAGFLQQRFMWVSGQKKLKNTKYKPWGCILQQIILNFAMYFGRDMPQHILSIY